MTEKQSNQNKQASLGNNNYFLDLSNFENQGSFYKDDFFTYYEVVDKKMNIKRAAAVSQNSLSELPREKLIDLSREVNIMIKLNHPLIIKFIGYCPVNFIDNKNPTILTEFFSRYSFRSSQDSDTQKIIWIYGIASAMSYLHSNNIIHCNLNPQNIYSYYQNKMYLPKIRGFHFSKDLSINSKESSFNGDSRYQAPEVLSSLKYSKSSDVYSFSLVVYNILTNEIPFSNLYKTVDFISNVVDKGIRPDFDESIDDVYKKLIEKCWSQDPNERPTFDEIVEELKTNPEFLTKEVNEKEYRQFIKFIDESPKSFDYDKKIDHIDKIIESQSHKFHRSEIELKYRNNPNSNSNSFLNLKDYKIKQLEDFKNIYNIYRVRNSKEKVKYLARIYAIEINEFVRNEIVNFCREVNIISQLNHPSILKFIGYSPINFDNQPKPVVFTEFCDCISLDITLDDSISKSEANNDTKKLIIMYGVAAGMAYLHSHNILHRDLKMSNIFLDKSNLPKISGFDISKEITNKNNNNKNEEWKEKSQHIKGTPAYLAPEVYLYQEYSKASDVYSYSLLVYELITQKKAYEEKSNIQEIYEEVCKEGYRPIFEKPIHQAYLKLIQRCWSQESDDRPTFDEIVQELKTNPEFLTDGIDIDEYHEYIKFIDEFPITFNPEKRIKQLDDILRSNIQSFHDIDFNCGINDLYETEMNGISLKNDFFNLDDYEDGFALGKGQNSLVLKIRNSKTNEIFVAKYFFREVEIIFSHEIINFSRSLNIMVKLNHPSIIKIVGYTGLNFNEGLISPVIVSEFAQNGTLEKKLKKDKKGEINDTKKLIIMYGVAAGMAYLHSHNILHRDLKMSNIFLDKSNLPKISGFDISKEITSKNNNNKNEEGKEKSQHIKGTPAYLAPEVYLYQEYSKASDVYSYSLLVYELITQKKAYEEKSNIQEIYEEVCKEGHRPIFEKPIHQAYSKLIQRCWSQESDDRPTFDEIVQELKTNPEFLTDGIDIDEYHEYIKFIDEFPITFNPEKRIKQLDNIISDRMWKFSVFDHNFYYKSIYETEKLNIILDVKYLNLRNYKKGKLIGKEFDYKIHEIIDVATGQTFLAKRRTIRMSYFEMPLLPFCQNLDHISKIKHPSILKFIGFSPVDFNCKPKFVIVSEYAVNGTLEKIFEYERSDVSQSAWNDTKKLIAIYGIASALSHWHSYDLSYDILTPTNIFLDDYLYPKLSLFNITDDNNKHDDYMAPECTEGKPADVFSFGTILYLILSNKETKKRRVFYSSRLPELKESIPHCYRVLIEKCWSEDPQERPTFDDILYELRSNKEFITGSINVDEYLNYVKYIEERSNLFELSFPEVKIDFHKVRMQSKYFAINMGSVNLDMFIKEKQIGKGGFGAVYKVIEKETQNTCAAKVSIFEIDQCSEDGIINLSREIEIISNLNHPSILKFIGYNPRNFKNKPKPVIITEFAFGGSLDVILNLERDNFGHHDWNDTKKLINIYGIAAGMNYMHKNNILHRDLKPANILLDEFLYPKIADFGLSKDLNEETEDLIPVSSGFKGTYAYCAPEIVLNQEYSKAGDVYAFGMIVYEIMTNKIPLDGQNFYQMITNIQNNTHLPFLDDSIPYCYRKLIKHCWKRKPHKRIAFDQIIRDLEKNADFITQYVDKEEYYNYIDYIKDTKENSNNSDKKESNASKHKVIFDSNRIVETEDDFESSSNCFIDLSNYEPQNIIIKNSYSKIYKLKDRKTSKNYAGQVSMMKIKKFSKEDVNNLSNEINIIKQMNHPTLLKFIGFSPIDFKNQRKPVVVTEFVSEGTLNDILEMERNEIQTLGWNETKKLIIIYGIASGMSYLHSKGIIHRCLKPSSIYIDNILFPKIGDFGLSTKFESVESITNQSISGLKIAPIYSAPEVLTSNEYSKASDVYSFAFIVYEIITNETPFKETSKNNKIFNNVIESIRPEIKENVPKCFRDLIEKCWSQNPSERPSFDDIIYYLKTDNEFVGECVNKEDYFNYIKFIDEKTKSNEVSQKITETDDKLFGNDKINLYVKDKTSNQSDENEKIKEYSEDETTSESNEEEEELNSYLDTASESYENDEKEMKSEEEEANESDKNDGINNFEEEEEARESYEKDMKSENEAANESGKNDDIKNFEEEEASESYENEEKDMKSEEKSITKSSELFQFYIKKAENGDIEAQEFLAKKFSSVNDTENTYKYMNLLIKSGNSRVPLEYAVNLYKSKLFDQSYNYFVLLSKINHPIAKYFIGLMKFFGHGCSRNKKEALEIMKYLSENGIDRASQFLDEHCE